MHNQKICNRCVMDTSDPRIQFDKDGFCNHCSTALDQMAVVARNIFEVPASGVFERLRKTSSEQYDCIIGLSGGLDSSYVLLKAVEHGLRPFVVHVDGGWNSSIAVSNIKRLVTKLKLELRTIVIPWNEMREIQLAYLKCGISNQDVPQDHAFFASLYKVAQQNKIRDVVTGSNFASESILPRSWEYDAMDGRQLRSISELFGVKIQRYPVLPLPMYYLRNVVLGGMRVTKPLNHAEYRRKHAICELQSEIGWQDYGGKHRESHFTNWFQHSYLPQRLGIDKRKAHLSSLIVSNQMTRKEAIAELEKPALEVFEDQRLTNYIAKKLKIDESLLATLVRLPEKKYSEFPNDEKKIKLISELRVSRAIQRLLDF